MYEVSYMLHISTTIYEALFIFFLDRLTPHLHINFAKEEAEEAMTIATTTGEATIETKPKEDIIATTETTEITTTEITTITEGDSGTMTGVTSDKVLFYNHYNTF